MIDPKVPVVVISEDRFANLLGKEQAFREVLNALHAEQQKVAALEAQLSAATAPTPTKGHLTLIGAPALPPQES